MTPGPGNMLDVFESDTQRPMLRQLVMVNGQPVSLDGQRGPVPVAEDIGPRGDAMDGKEAAFSGVASEDVLASSVLG